ncbi:lipopolysaccharide biosynthesis protein [Mycobacterium sp. NPDC048908]|uniref:lipopolysaccharide biosynthesis protein n=1 Tax=Mycobacterium sp. NPDC048908 TaxID=3364292 RepID=UPI00371085B5
MPPAFARNTFLGFVSGAATSLAAFIGNAIAARLLGSDGMGVIAYAVWCINVAATIAGLGIGLVLQRFIPNLRAEDKNDAADGLIGATARLSIVATLVGGLLLFGWLYWPGSTAMAAPSQTSRTVLVALVLASFICKQMADVYLAYLRGEQRFGDFARLSSLSALLKLSVTVLGAWLFGVAGVLAAFIAASLIPASGIWQMLREKARVGTELRRHVMRFALTGWLAAVISGLVWGRTEIVFLEHYAGISAVGIFAAAAMLTDMAMQLPPLFLAALLPYFSEQHGLGAHDQIRRMYRTMTGILGLLVVPSCVGIAAIAPVLVPLLFGTDFADAVPVATVLLVAAAVTAVSTTTANLIYSTGKIGFLLISNAFGLVGTIVLGFLVIPRFGLMGAAWSRAIVQVFVVVIETWYITRKLGVAPPYRALVAITLAAAVQGAVAYSVCAWIGGVASLMLAVPAAIAVFLVALRVLRALPMVDPALIDTAIAHAPRQVRNVLSCVLKLVSPVSERRHAPD